LADRIKGVEGIDVSWIRGNFNSHKNGYARLYRMLGTRRFMSAKDLQKVHNAKHDNFKYELTIFQVARMMWSLSEFNDGEYVEVAVSPFKEHRGCPLHLFRRRSAKEIGELRKKRNNA